MSDTTYLFVIFGTWRDKQPRGSGQTTDRKGDISCTSRLSRFVAHLQEKKRKQNLSCVGMKLDLNLRNEQISSGTENPFLLCQEISDQNSHFVRALGQISHPEGVECSMAINVRNLIYTSARSMNHISFQVTRALRIITQSHVTAILRDNHSASIRVNEFRPRQTLQT